MNLYLSLVFTCVVQGVSCCPTLGTHFSWY